MDIQESVSLKSKTTMRIGGVAQYYAEPRTQEDIEQAYAFAQKHTVPLLVLGGGSNTIFADGVINALIIRMKADTVTVSDTSVTVEAGKNLPVLINELASEGLDLSPLTGILGSVGGAVFGNAGQGPAGIWIDSFIDSVTVFEEGTWKTYEKKECDFRYRESAFKDSTPPPIIWSTTLTVPKKDPREIQETIEQLLQKRIETQPHVKTAGSCFKAVGDTPAWQLIDAAGLRSKAVGGVHISEKHANFLISNGEASFDDAVQIVKEVQQSIDEPLRVEMRFVNEDGSLAF